VEGIYFLTQHYVMKAYWEVEAWIHSFFDLGTDGGKWSASRSDHFTSREKVPGIHWIGKPKDFNCHWRHNYQWR